MQITNDSILFIFDVESLGIHGTGFAWAAGCFDMHGSGLLEMSAHCPVTDKMREGVSEKDLEWIKANVTMEATSVECSNARHLRALFLAALDDARVQYGDRLIIVAENAWPVEGNFLSAAIRDDIATNRFRGPYPLVDSASIMLAAGICPQATYPRTESESPAHNPTRDVRQSYRLLMNALQRISGKTPTSPN